MGFWDKCVLAFCRLGVVGLCPVAPGTACSAVAALLAPWLFLPLDMGWRVAVLEAIFVAGALGSSRAEILLGREDPGEAVIDELLGVWLVLLPFTDADWRTILAAFILFRIFDIWKPWIIDRSQHWLPGGWSVMLDDALAAIPAMAGVALLRWLGVI